jgi:penicillin amidase
MPPFGCGCCCRVGQTIVFCGLPCPQSLRQTTKNDRLPHGKIVCVALQRALKYFNIAIFAVLMVSALGVYWMAYRPLPQTSGTLRAPLRAKATIARDALGVPHITAASINDVLFLQGYATAQDRLWQMDGLRRAAAGRLSEVLGPATLEADREARRLRMDRIAEADAANLPPQDRAVLAAYMRGVNFFIESHRGNLPIEFSLLRYDSRPWTVKDSVLIGLYMYRLLTTSWQSELQKSALLSGDREKVEFLFQTRAGGEIQPGSNAWVLAGKRTANGRPLLANDPHLEYSMPGIWHAVHLKAPGLNVAGVALPGVPCVIVGHNDRIGWGVTNLQFDVQDLYIEKLDTRTGRYVFGGAVEQARLERELIPVRGAPPEEYAAWVTRHGPVFRDGGRYLALRWAAADGGFTFPLLDLNRARNFQEFTAALARYPGPGQNFVYADVDGNIGYQATGRLPVRKTYDGTTPVDGSTGEFEWQGYVPFEQLPRSYNPPSGIIVTANQNPFPDSYSYRVTGNFASPYRSMQIYNLLVERNGWSAADMVRIQKDVYSAFHHFLARQVVAAYDRRGAANPAVAGAVEILRSWNGQMESGVAPLIATLVYQHVRKAALPLGTDSIQMAPAAIERLFRERPKTWFADYDQVLLAAFLDAIEEGRRIQGRDVSKWDWGRYNQLLLSHPVGSKIPAAGKFVGKYFDIGPVRQSGSTASVKQTTRRLGPSMRMALDFADLDKSTLNLLAGESGQVLSEHYKDQWEAWYYGRTFPMQFNKVEAKSTLTVVPE